MNYQAKIGTEEAPAYTAPLTVETIGNHIYFYSNVTSDRCLALIQQIKEADTNLRNQQLSREVDHPTPIWLHINSLGGEIFSAFAVADQIARIKTPIYSIIEGVAASAGTLISMSCHKRYITPSSFMLIHQLSGAAWGTYEQIKDETHLFDMLMGVLEGFYANHSKLTKKKVRELLQRDSWLSADESILLGLVDKIK